MSEKPNIVIIITDQQRADVSAREGFPLDTTPCLDDLARQGTWFNRAYTALLSGQASGRSGVNGAYVRPGEARRSALVDYLFNSPSYHWLSDEERRTIISWIDLGARWDGRAVER